LIQSFKITYEELKYGCVVKISPVGICFKITYEELKSAMSVVPAFAAERFKITYEELKFYSHSSAHLNVLVLRLPMRN